MKLVRDWLFLCFCCAPFCVLSLELNDFAPNLINSSNLAESSTNNKLIVFSLPESSQSGNVSNTGNIWPCDKVIGTACNNVSKVSSSSVIAQGIKPTAVTAQQQPVSIANQGANDQYFNRNGNSFDQNAINNFNITNSNQTTMQAYSPQLNNATIEDKLKQNIAIPLSTGSNSAVSVGANNVQFNVSY